VYGAEQHNPSTLRWVMTAPRRCRSSTIKTYESMGMRSTRCTGSPRRADRRA
jgi:hypothetical protein